ncbi:fibroblast growth factor-binding protein 3 [Discoglossus pictus]
MRLSRVISFIFFVNCLSTFQEVFAKKEKASNKRGETQAFQKNGQFATKHNHECSWEITNEDDIVTLSLSCNEHGNNSYKCAYKGEPQKCPLYSTKAKQYWKPILAKFKKMKNVCESKILKSRICKKAAAVDSQLVKIGTEVVADMEKGKTKGKGRVKEPAKGPEERSQIPEENENVGAEKKSDAKKKKLETKSNQKPDPSNHPSTQDPPNGAREVNDDIIELNEDIAEEYCAQKWHSVCSFFVNFWNG